MAPELDHRQRVRPGAPSKKRIDPERLTDLARPLRPLPSLAAEVSEIRFQIVCQLGRRMTCPTNPGGDPMP